MCKKKYFREQFKYSVIDSFHLRRQDRTITEKEHYFMFHINMDKYSKKVSFKLQTQIKYYVYLLYIL